MKTNRSARRIVKVRDIALCLAFIGMAGVAFSLGRSLAVRVGQTSALQAEVPQAPRGSFADLIAAAQ